jgi:hypothetical protein
LVLKFITTQAWLGVLGAAVKNEARASGGGPYFLCEIESMELDLADAVALVQSGAVLSAPREIRLSAERVKQEAAAAK